MIPRYQIGILYRTQCHLCSATHDEHWSVYAGGELPNPSLPDDWFVLDGRAYCSAHKIEIKTPKKKSARTRK